MSDLNAGNIGFNLVLKNKTAISDGVRQDAGKAEKTISSFAGTISGHFGRIEQRASSFASSMSRSLGKAFESTKLDNFGKECTKVESGLGKIQNKAGGFFGKLSSTAGRGLSSFAGTIFGHFGRIEQRTSSFASNMTRLLGGAFAIKKLIDFGKGCIDLGSDLEEVQNVVDVAFGDMSSQIDGWAQGAARAFGLSETMAKRYSGTYGSMAKAFGFSKEDAAAMSTTLAGLAGDVASFYNIDQDSAYTKLKSVFTGETESLKDLGVVMTQTALDSFAMANGFGRTTQQMSESEKVALRYLDLNTRIDMTTVIEDSIIKTAEQVSSKELHSLENVVVLKEKVAKGEITLNLNLNKQLPHMESSRANGASYLTISLTDLQNLVNQKYGTGNVIIKRAGQIKEIIELEYDVGMIIDRLNPDARGIPTNRITIHYSKKRTHVVPARRWV